MGQATLTTVIACYRENAHSHRSNSKTRSTALVSHDDDDDSRHEVVMDAIPNYISDLPDECLASIFQSLSFADCNRCSLVCRKWLQIKGESHHCLSLNTQSDLLSVIPSIFSRFDSITKLALKCDRRSVSINDDVLVLIFGQCPNLTRLKLRAFCNLTDAGMETLAKNCKGLNKLSCGSCTFRSKRMNALLKNCAALEELSIKHNYTDRCRFDRFTDF